jgi:hypothetical protein
MIEYISLVTGSVIRNLNNSTIILQTQDPFVTFGSQVLSVIVGGLIALIANYFLQMHSFNVQNETNRMNLRIAAYIALLGHISNYKSNLDMSFIADMGFYLTKAAAYGSPEIKALIKPEIRKSQISKSHEFDSSIDRIKNAII